MCAPVTETYHEGANESSPYALQKSLVLSRLQNATKLCDSHWDNYSSHRIWDSKTSWSISYQPSSWCIGVIKLHNEDDNDQQPMTHRHTSAIYDGVIPHKQLYTSERNLNSYLGCLFLRIVKPRPGSSVRGARHEGGASSQRPCTARSIDLSIIAAVTGQRASCWNSTKVPSLHELQQSHSR